MAQLLRGLRWFYVLGFPKEAHGQGMGEGARPIPAGLVSHSDRHYLEGVNFTNFTDD